MLKKDVQIGKHYTAKIGNDLTVVRIDGESRFGGWDATNVLSRRSVRIKSAQKLRSTVTDQEVKTRISRLLKREDRAERVKADVSPNGHHKWFVLVEINDQTDMKANDLEGFAQDAAESVYPPFLFANAYIVMDDGFGKYVRPHWSQDHKVES